MNRKIREFYEQFAEKLLREYVHGNARVARQFEFLKDAVPGHSQRILVVGCGIGEIVYFLATKRARKSYVLGVDLSLENISIAKKLFAHSRVEFRQGNILEDLQDGNWELIILPDVYEHIPVSERDHFHAVVHRLLAPNGSVLMTLPSCRHQQMLRERGCGLQIVDEDVTLADLIRMSRDLNAVITYYREITIWNSNDYIHVVMERGAGSSVQNLQEEHFCGKRKSCPPIFPFHFCKRMRVGFGVMCRYFKVWYRLRRIPIRNK